MQFLQFPKEKITHQTVNNNTYKLLLVFSRLQQAVPQGFRFVHSQAGMWENFE